MERPEFVVFIENFAKQLKVTNVTIAKAMLFCHLFKQSVLETNYDMKMVAAAAISLVIKINKEPVDHSAKDVVFYNLIFDKSPSGLHSDTYKEFNNKLMNVELFLLKMLEGHTEHKVAHLYLEEFLKCIRFWPEIFQIWSIVVTYSRRAVSDFYCYSKVTHYKPEHIAIGAIEVALHLTGFSKSFIPGWQKAFCTEYSPEIFHDICLLLESTILEK